MRPRPHAISKSTASALGVVYEIDWTDAVAREDARRDYGELRLRTLIVGPGGERYVIVFTPRHGRHRIISIRHAHVKEYERWQRL